MFSYANGCYVDAIMVRLIRYTVLVWMSLGVCCLCKCQAGTHIHHSNVHRKLSKLSAWWTCLCRDNDLVQGEDISLLLWWHCSLFFCFNHLSDACNQCWVMVECNTLLLCECSENTNWFSLGSLQHHHNHGLLKHMVSQAMSCAMLCPWQACFVNVVSEWDQSLRLLTVNCLFMYSRLLVSWEHFVAKCTTILHCWHCQHHKICV